MPRYIVPLICYAISLWGSKIPTTPGQTHPFSSRISTIHLIRALSRPHDSSVSRWGNASSGKHQIQSIQVDPIEKSGEPICGLNDDTAVHVPTNYESFVPPPRGGSYKDPTFGCVIHRLTDSAHDNVAEDLGLCNANHFYSTQSPINAEDDKIILIDQCGGTDYYIVDLDGQKIIDQSRYRDLRPNRGSPLWDSTDGNVFYFTRANSLMRAAIKGKNRISSSVVHTFRQYEVVVLPDKTDVSSDGKIFAMWGGTTTGLDPLAVFTYDMGKNSVSSVYKTTCTQDASKGQGPCVHGITQTADGNVIIGFANVGDATEQSNRLWREGVLTPVQNLETHFDTGYDLARNSVMVTVFEKDRPDSCPHGGGHDIKIITTSGRDVPAFPQPVTCLVDTWWMNGHVSSHFSRPEMPWVVLSMDDLRQEGPSPEWFNNGPGFLKPKPCPFDSKREQNCWYPYEGEIMMARIDAENNPSKIYRLAHSRSRTRESFWSQVRASLSRDGKYVIFDSNMAYVQKGCPSLITRRSGAHICSDVFWIKVQ